MRNLIMGLAVGGAVYYMFTKFTAPVARAQTYDLYPTTLITSDSVPTLDKTPDLADKWGGLIVAPGTQWEIEEPPVKKWPAGIVF